MIPRVALLLAAVIALTGKEELKKQERGPLLRVPRTASEPVLDGDLDEAIWTGAAARTGPIGTRPFSEARFAWHEDALLVGLYAADENITSRVRDADGPVWLDDAFRLVFTTDDGTETAIDLSPSGVVTDAQRKGGAFDYAWQSGARVGHELDGTANDPRDDDEEWVLEMALPRRPLGLAPGARIHLSIRRCDTPRGARQRGCAAWQGDLVLE
jgi:hypothetical protein